MPKSADKPKAQLYYDFELNKWALVFPSGRREYYGDTPEECVASAKHDCNKHDLWDGDNT